MSAGVSLEKQSPSKLAIYRFAHAPVPCTLHTAQDAISEFSNVVNYIRCRLRFRQKPERMHASVHHNRKSEIPLTVHQAPLWHFRCVRSHKVENTLVTCRWLGLLDACTTCMHVAQRQSNAVACGTDWMLALSPVSCESPF